MAERAPISHEKRGIINSIFRKRAPAAGEWAPLPKDKDTARKAGIKDRFHDLPTGYAVASGTVMKAAEHTGFKLDPMDPLKLEPIVENWKRQGGDEARLYELLERYDRAWMNPDAGSREERASEMGRIAKELRGFVEAKEAEQVRADADRLEREEAKRAEKLAKAQAKEGRRLAKEEAARAKEHAREAPEAFMSGRRMIRINLKPEPKAVKGSFGRKYLRKIPDAEVDRAFGSLWPHEIVGAAMGGPEGMKLSADEVRQRFSKKRGGEAAFDAITAALGGREHRDNFIARQMGFAEDVPLEQQWIEKGLDPNDLERHRNALDKLAGDYTRRAQRIYRLNRQLDQGKKR